MNDFYKIFKLNYLYQDLEPYLSTRTIAIHYNKHTKTYLNNLNKILYRNDYKNNYKIWEIYNHLNEFNKEDIEDLLFNLGGVLNHYLYFNCLNKQLIKPKGLLLEKINTLFNNYETFLEKIKEKALELKGSGYVFLELDKDNNLLLTKRTNQENPFYYGNLPLFCIDMWEHAYYLNYQNDKNNYLENIFKILDFTYANNLYNYYISNKKI